jgi:hypothetical protein
MPTKRARSASGKKKIAKQSRRPVKTPAIFETVRRIALSLSDVEETTSYGTPAFKRGDSGFIRMHQDGESLVVRTDFEQRKELIAGDPDTYYITDHYLNYEWVLVRLSRVQPEALGDLIRMAWRWAAASKSRGSRRPDTDH